jgi:hypothetical protein
MSLYEQNASTADGGESAYALAEARRVRNERIGPRRLAAAIARLVRERRRLAHWPTIGQVRSMARLQGREPCSYLLDPRVNFVPELLAGYEAELGRHALCFTARLPHGVREFVALSDGGGFDLVGGGS